MTASHMCTAVFLMFCARFSCLSTNSSQAGHAQSRTNTPHIDVAHVAPAKIDAKYITVNCSCIFNYVQVQYVIYQPKNHINVSKYIYYRQDEVILTIVYQIESRSQFKVGIKVTFILNSRLCGQCSQTTIPDYGQIFVAKWQVHSPHCGQMSIFNIS